MDEEELEEFYAKGKKKKDTRKQRRELSVRDRSKFKKTNKEQLKKRSELYQDSKEGVRGKVLSIQGQESTVDCSGKILRCVLRGVLKRDRLRKKNLLAVGDWVLVNTISKDEGVILSIEPRTSVLARADNLSRNKEQLIAANIDQVFITLSVGAPRFKRTLVDRYLISARKGHMQPIILINKIDLIQGNELGEELIEEKAAFEEFLAYFQKLGVPCFAISANTGEGMEQLKEMMKNTSSVFSGQSGVGKSSLINNLTGLNLEVGETVERTKKGSHTTTKAQLIPLPCGGWLIDTPGIKSFGVWNLEPEEVREYFSDFVQYHDECQFPQCYHLQEPGCRIKVLIEEKVIPYFRYESYQMLMKTATEKHQKR